LGIRFVAELAFTQCFGPLPNAAADCAHREAVADRRGAGKTDRTITDRKFDVVVDL
jgi:hypothetical protein